MENYASYEDFILTSHVAKLMRQIESSSEEFEFKFIRGEKGSFWHIKFNGSEFLVSIVPVMSMTVERKKEEGDTLYYSRVIKSWKS